jgi:hypothetical protein
MRYQDMLYTSADLQPNNLSSLPQPVQDFVSGIRNDTGLRWSGDLSTPDPVHIDDHLNANQTALQEKVTAVQATAQQTTQGGGGP